VHRKLLSSAVKDGLNPHTKLDNLCWSSQHRSPTPHFWGVCTQGGNDPQIQTRPRFLYNAPTPKFLSSYVYSFGSYDVDKHTQTNRQTDRQTLPKISNALRYVG